jgi:hypothetical protein
MVFDRLWGSTACFDALLEVGGGLGEIGYQLF